MKRVNRRYFLKSFAFAATTLPFAGRVIVSDARGATIVGANEKVRVGLIGCGGMGRGDLDTFFIFPEVDCPVICDVDDAMLARGVKLVEEKRGKKPDTVKDFRRVLERKDIDAVIVATPDHWHALPTVLACQAGKDVYVEKPLAKTIPEGRAMVVATQRHNRVVQMGTQWRSGKHWKDAVDFVKSGKLGKIGLVHLWVYLDWIGSIGKPSDCDPPAGVDYDMWLGPAPKRPFNPNRFHFNFRWFWDYAGGLMTDWGVHLLNIVVWAMGAEHNLVSVSSTGGKYVLDDNSETPDTQITVYEFEKYSIIWEHKVGMGVGMNNRPWGVSFAGSEGSLIVNDSGWELIGERKNATIEPAKFGGSGDARPAHIRNFLDCIKTREKPVEHLEFAHYVTTLAHLGNISFRSGHKIRWDRDKERVLNDKLADSFVGVDYRKPWKLPYYPR
ncbi:MAG: Gfo/Idh/MocA family protein [Verrucomicrobiia bacterium]